uniref:Spire type actin nucleation factor 1 n=1 Tax=Oncorhynchus kisutch TaxID=8019 RepID=A0A8C7GNJ0_ONCKI
SVDERRLRNTAVKIYFSVSRRYLYSWDLNMDIADGAEDLSLEEILSLYSQPINEEQAWAVCYQCCRTLARKHRRRNSQTSGSSVGDLTRRIEGPGDVRILRDGTVQLHHQDSAGKQHNVIESLGIMIYKALDYSLKESEERELSPPLEQLIDMMTNMAEKERDSDPCPDEGYEATEEEEDEEDPNTVCNVKGFRDIIMLCTSHLPSPSDAPNHYQAVCRALYAETRELRSFLEKIRSAKENLRRMEGDTREEPVRDLNELQNADWAKFWMQVMGDLRNGVKLKKVQERQYSPLPVEFQLTPYEMLMDDIRFKRYKLRNVMLNGDIPPRLKKSAHEVILDFIRSRPPLNPVAARKLKPHPARPRSLHERLLEGIKQERKLRPVSPDMTRRNHLDLSTPDVLRKHASSTLALSCPPAHGVGGALGQRKRLLKAPTLAELYSSESDVNVKKIKTACSLHPSSLSSLSPPAPPRLLPITMTPQPDSRPSPQRRHSIEKEPPTSVRPFTAPTRQSSKSLEDFCYPVECLALTVEEVMHIRQVLVKAELEKFQQYKDVYNELRKGKLCFSCQTKRFSFFTWSYTCQVCKRPVCSQCCKKMRLPSKPYANLPVSSLGPTATLPREEAGGTSALDTPEKPSSSHSLRRTVSRYTITSLPPELDLPKELTDDWCTMEVCINCKKFISEIISSSKRSLTLATKRACLKRKTQSFYLSSPNTDDYRPSERTINQV